MERPVAGPRRLSVLATARNGGPPAAGGPGGWCRRLVLGWLAACLAPAVTAPAGAQGSGSASPVVEMAWTLDFAPHGDPVLAVSMTVEGADACAVPAGTADLDGDPGRGVVVSLDGTEVYRTGSDNIVIDDDYVDTGEGDDWSTHSVLDYYAADSFFLHTAWPFEASAANLAISCLADDGTWWDVFEQGLTVPDPAGIMPFIAGYQVDDDGLLFAVFVDPTYTRSPPLPGDLVATIDGRPVTLDSWEDPDYGPLPDVFVATPPADLVPGRHVVELTWTGMTEQYPLVVDDLDSLVTPPGDAGPTGGAIAAAAAVPSAGDTAASGLDEPADGAALAFSDAPAKEKDVFDRTGTGPADQVGGDGGGAGWPVVVGGSLVAALGLGPLARRRWFRPSTDSASSAPAYVVDADRRPASRDHGDP
jgi:hypothetical protein